jgi:hypothetical protein
MKGFKGVFTIISRDLLGFLLKTQIITKWPSFQSKHHTTVDLPFDGTTQRK